MNCNDEYIVKLCKASIYDKIPESPKVTLDWNYIYNKSVEQNIAGLLFTAVSKLDAEFQPDNKLMEKWNSAMISTIVAMGSRYNEFFRIKKLMQDNRITFIGLKGCVVRNLYPVPELRTMGDFDILTQKENLSRIADIFKSQGYIIEDYFFGINVDSAKAHWEIFITTEEEIKVNTKKWDEIFFENQEENNICNTLKPTYFLAHMIIHTARHFIQQGAGIRNLLDIALYINKFKDDIDFKVVETICKEQNYFKIYCYILNSVNLYFDVNISNIIYSKLNCDKFIEYMLLNGVFGKNDNVLIRQVALDEDKNKRKWIRLLFPSAHALQNRYKYLRKFPFLLPIAWIQRIIYGRFNKKVTFLQMFRSTSEAFDFSDERIRRLEELGLDNKH